MGTMEMLAAGYSVAQLSAQVNQLSDLFQSLALGYLLRGQDASRYQENLVRSAQSRVFLNEALAADEANDRHLGLSRSRGIFAALAAGQLPLAVAVVDTSCQQWHRAWEYEDDHCYYLVIHQLVLALTGKPADDCLAILARWRNILGGETETRLDLCSGLVERQPQQVQQALAALMAESKTGISVEVLGLANLANQLQMPLPDISERFPVDALCAFEERSFDNFFAELKLLN